MSHVELYIHIVWATKHRQPLLTAEREAAVYRCVMQQVQPFGHEVLAINGTEDHVHLVIESAPILVLPKMMKSAKGVSSTLVNDMSGHESHFRWQEGYFAMSVTPSHLPKVIEYVKNQKEHHRAGTLYPLWEET